MELTLNDAHLTRWAGIIWKSIVIGIGVFQQALRNS